MKNMRLKLARVEMNLSQEELAAKVNVTRPTINLLEGGKFNPSLQLCIRICKVLNKTRFILGGGQLMKTTIHCDERITNIRHTIYVKLFWGIIIANELTYLLDYFFKTSLNDWVIPLAPDVLIIWMSIKGVLFNGTQHFPLWCWLFALCYSSLNTIIVFVESFQIDTVFYLEQINQRIIVSLIFLTVYFLVVLLFFYISYRIAIRKIKKLSTDI